MRLASLLLSAMLVLATSRVYGQDVPPDIPPGNDVIQPLSRGQAAPFQGMLLDTDTSIRWANRIRWYQGHTELLRLLQTELQVATSQHQARELQILERSYDREIDGLRDDLRKQAEVFARQSDPPFYRTFSFGLVVGLTGSAILMALTVWALSAI